MESRTRAETDRMFPGGVTDTLYKIDDLLGRLADMGMVDECWALRNAIETTMREGGT